MKKFLKILLIALGALLIVIAGIMIWGIDTIQTEPYFSTTYYKVTKERLDSTLNHLRMEHGGLNAGFGRVHITPSINPSTQDPDNGIFAEIPLAGYGDRKLPVQGIHDSIFVKAVALQVEQDPIVFVGTDLLLVPMAVADSVYAILYRTNGMTRDQIFFGATHTHSSIGASTAGYAGEKFGGSFQPKVVKWLSIQIVKTINQAITDLRPASIGYGHFEATEFVKNRMIGATGRLNDIFTFVSIRQDQGRSAVLGSFSAHATTLGASNLLFSGDYPGYWERKLESGTVDMAVFYAGTVGSHSNRSMGSGFEKSQYIGEALADSVALYLNKVKLRDIISLTHFTTVIDVPTMQVRVSDNLHLDEYIGHKLLPGINYPSIQGMKIDSFIWMTLPCELSGEYAIDLINALQLEGYQSTFTVFNGSYLGYVVPAKYYHFENYESYLMGWYGPSMGDYIMELLYTSCNALTHERL